jgi:hypothetical protein
MAENGNIRNRRYKTVGACVALVTLAYYVCIARGVELGWFEAYANFMKWAVIIAVAGLTATDAVSTWKNGNGGGK